MSTSIQSITRPSLIDASVAFLGGDGENRPGGEHGRGGRVFFRVVPSEVGLRPGVGLGFGVHGVDSKLLRGQGDHDPAILESVPTAPPVF